MSIFLLPKVINTHNTDTNDIQTLLRPSETIIHRYSLASLQFQGYKINFMNLTKIDLKKTKNDSEIEDFVMFITNERLIFYHINLRIGVYFYILSISAIDNDNKNEIPTKLHINGEFHDNKYTIINDKSNVIELCKHEFFCGVCFFKIVIKSRVTNLQNELEEIDCTNCGSHLAKNDMFLYTNIVVHETNTNTDHMVCSKCTHDNSEYFQKQSNISNNCRICENPLIFIDLPLLSEPVCIAFKADQPIDGILTQLINDTKKLANSSLMKTNSSTLLKLLNNKQTESLEMGIKSIINKYDEDIKKLDFLHDVTLSTMTNFLESIDDIDEYLHLSKTSIKSHITITDFFIKNNHKVIKMNELYYLYNFEMFRYRYLNCQDFIDMINVSDLLQIYIYNNVSYVINNDLINEYISKDYTCGNVEYDAIIKDKLTYQGYYLIDFDSSNIPTYYFNNAH